jgi:hypothetical protein
MIYLEFSLYQPAAWVEDGLLTTFVRKVREVPKRMARRGKWSVGASIVFVAAFQAATLSGAILQSPNEIVEINVLESGTRRLRPDEYVTPPGYWDKLGAAIMAVERLPAQDISKDPPVMV